MSVPAKCVSRSPVMGNTGSLLDVVTYLETPFPRPGLGDRQAEISSQLFKKPEKVPLPRISSDTTRNRPGHRATRARNILEDEQGLGVIPPSSFTREVPSPHKVILSPLRYRRPPLRIRKRSSQRLSSSSSSDELSTCSEDSQETKLINSYIEDIEDITDISDQKTDGKEAKPRSRSSIPIAAKYLEPGERLETDTREDETETEVPAQVVLFPNPVRAPYSFARQQRGMVVPTEVMARRIQKQYSEI